MFLVLYTSWYSCSVSCADSSSPSCCLPTQLQTSPCCRCCELVLTWYQSITGFSSDSGFWLVSSRAAFPLTFMNSGLPVIRVVFKVFFSSKVFFLSFTLMTKWKKSPRKLEAFRNKETVSLSRAFTPYNHLLCWILNLGFTSLAGLSESSWTSWESVEAIGLSDAVEKPLSP